MKLELTNAEINTLIKTMEEQSFLVESKVLSDHLKKISQKLRTKYAMRKSEFLMKGYKCKN